MSISSIKTPIASAVAFSAARMLCSLLVRLFPEIMMNLSCDMFHIDVREIVWQISPMSALVGLIGWAVLATVYITLISSPS